MLLAIIARHRKAEFILGLLGLFRHDRVGTPAAVMEGVARVNVLAHHEGHGHERESNESAWRMVVALVLESGALAATECGGRVCGGGVVGEVPVDGTEITRTVAVLYAELGLAPETTGHWSCGLGFGELGVRFRWGGGLEEEEEEEKGRKGQLDLVMAMSMMHFFHDFARSV